MNHVKVNESPKALSCDVCILIGIPMDFEILTKILIQKVLKIVVGF